MDRREFLGWVGVGALASSLPVAIAACSNNTEEVKTAQQTKTDTEGFTVVGTIAQLNEKGSILNEDLEVIVVRNLETDQIVALNSVCPHAGCNVKWEDEDKNLKCPCHDSKFAVDGKLLKGPAREGLAVYEVKEEKESILVKIA